MATQSDVARAAGVSRATVSRALDPERRHLINPETVRRIEDTAAALGYRPNLLARGLKRGRSGVVALVLRAQLTPAAQATLVRAVSSRLAEQGQVALVIHDPENGAGGSAARPDTGADNAATAQAATLVDGAIVVTAQPGGSGVSASLLRSPVVTIGFSTRSEADVVIDEPAAVDLAVRHLVRLGHRRIALIAEPPASPRAAGFHAAYRAAFTELVGHVDEELIHPFLPSHPASGRDACRSLFHRGTSPTAIVTTDDATAMACYGAVRPFGLSVGRDVAVTGLGDTPPAPYVEPPLTTISMPYEPAAIAATDLLLGQILADEPGPVPTGATAAGPRTFAPYLVHRMSTFELPPSPAP